MVVAAADDDAIGHRNSLPWHLPEDLRRFRRLTTGHGLILGRATHDSILTRLGHPLPGRHSFVLSARPVARSESEDVTWVTALDEAVEKSLAAAAERGQSAVYVIGGASVYEQLLPRIGRLYLTRVHGAFPADTFLPAGWLDGFRRERAEPVPGGVDPRGADTPAATFEDYVRAAP